MGLFSAIGNVLGFGGNDPAQGAFDPNDPRFKLSQGNTLQGQAQAGIQKFGTMPALQLPTVQADQSRMQLQDALGFLRQQATGAAPSVAQNQLYQSTDRSIGQLAGALAANRGLNAGTGLRAILSTGADALQGTNANAATLRAGETSTAQNSLLNALNMLRGQDITQATAQANTQLQGQEQNNVMLKYFTDLSRGVSQDDLKAALQLAGNNTTYAAGQNTNASNLIGNVLGGLSGFGGKMAAG